MNKHHLRFASALAWSLATACAAPPSPALLGADAAVSISAPRRDAAARNSEDAPSPADTVPTSPRPTEGVDAASLKDAGSGARDTMSPPDLSAGPMPDGGVPLPRPGAWAFAAISDIRTAAIRTNGPLYEAVLKQLRRMTDHPTPEIPSLEFVVGAGDMDMTADNELNWRMWKQAFAGAPRRPAFLHVWGNHDGGSAELEHTKTVKLPYDNVRGVWWTNSSSWDYHVDWKNVRLVALGRTQNTTEVEALLKNTPPHIDHVFLSFHYPVFPRKRYAGITPPDKREFWRMLVRHADKVPAALVSHTHSYSRMRVRNPDGPAATDLGAYPDEAGGVYQVDTGNAGLGGASTIVVVVVDGRNVSFYTVAAPQSAPDQFRVVDRWDLQRPLAAASTVPPAEATSVVKRGARGLHVPHWPARVGSRVELFDQEGRRIAAGRRTARGVSGLPVARLSRGDYFLGSTTGGLPYFQRLRVQ